MAAVLKLEKPLVFACGQVKVAGGGGGGGGGAARRVEVVRGNGAINMLANCAHIVDVAAAQCAVPADKARELAAIGAENHAWVNRTGAAALSTGVTAARANVSEVDAFDCGEPGSLRALAVARVAAAFLAACSAGQLVVLVELRRAHGEAVSAYLAGERGGGDGKWNPVWVASLNGRRDVVEWLVGDVGASAGAVNLRNGSSAVYVAATNGHLDVVRALANAGANVDQAEKDGRSPLWMAAQNGHVEVVQALMGAGASVDQATEVGATPLYVAVQSGHLNMVRTLVGAGASVDQAMNGGATPLIFAVQLGHLEMVRVLVHAGASVDQARKDGFTPLFMAAAKGRLDEMHALVGAGASVNHAAEDGRSALFTAAQFGHVEVVRALVGAGADPSTCMTSNGWSPLFVAAWSGHAAVVAELLQHSADRSAATTQDDDEIPAGSTALSVAQLKGHQDVVELLRR